MLAREEPRPSRSRSFPFAAPSCIASALRPAAQWEGAAAVLLPKLASASELALASEKECDHACGVSMSVDMVCFRCVYTLPPTLFRRCLYCTVCLAYVGIPSLFLSSVCLLVVELCLHAPGVSTDFLEAFGIGELDDVLYVVIRCLGGFCKTDSARDTA